MTVAAAVLLLGAALGPGQDPAVPPEPRPSERAPEPPAPSDEAEVVWTRRVPYAPGRAFPLDLVVGEARLRRVVLDVAQMEAEEDSILGVLRGEDATTSSDLRVRFDVEGEPAEPWLAQVQIELLDGRGRRIDRFRASEALEPGVTEIHLERGILSYVLPLVRTVRIRIEARRDV